MQGNNTMNIKHLNKKLNVCKNNVYYYIKEEAPCNLGMAVRSDEAFCSGRLMRPQIEQERESLTFVQMCLKFSKRYPALCNSQISYFMNFFYQFNQVQESGLIMILSGSGPFR
jgi:hypothetical protein